MLRIVLTILILFTGCSQKKSESTVPDNTPLVTKIAEETNPDLHILREALRSFASSLSEQDYTGIESLVCTESLDENYNDVKRQISNILQFPLSEITEYQKGLTDPDQIYTGRLAIAYKQYDMDLYHALCDSALIRGLLDRVSYFNGMRIAGDTLLSVRNIEYLSNESVSVYETKSIIYLSDQDTVVDYPITQRYRCETSESGKGLSCCLVL